MTVAEIREKYPYLYETHLHTSQASACARSTGREMARAHKEAGYTGIFVTDHNWGGNTCVDRSLPWEEWVTQFFAGYREAAEEGAKIGLQVFPAYEAGYHGPEFLIYGIDEEKMKRHPELKEATVSEQLSIVHGEGGMVIQAHPFREEWYIEKVELYPDDVDGCEAVNATHSSPKSQSHNNPLFDDRAIAYAKEHNFPTTAGSDVHSVNVFGGGMAFKTKLESVEDFINRVLGREDYVLTNGVKWYTPAGDVIAEEIM